ncbi:nucleolar complex protein 14 [Elasticomyces elasticus]|nr:nucleolar complex protein 14 [Elasticomyces elasticus]KAK4918912.1 nucleolar complex protein 14 [Elasticomyces elasticus]KAK5753796.1 nucleolar complex protein 14 [Elasticomyces elasticus]
MPPSQLKALKTSLREKGITAPSKSRKDKKNGPPTTTSGRDRATALAKIRTEMNPYEYRHISSRPAKFPSTSVKGSYKDVLLRRPGVSVSKGEEVRRKQLLPEMRGRLKSGGLVDRRIGEGDGGMGEEERAVARFARERGRNVFDLEGSDEEGGGGGLLTHGGRAIADLEDDDMKLSGDEGGSDEDDGFLVRKRQREDEEDEVVDEQPDVKKSKKEVMTELIAKSKLHKYERQKTKEDDDDLRDKLDAGMADLLPLLRAQVANNLPPPPPPKPVEVDGDVSKINPERQKLLDGMDRGAADREYEKRLRELARDTRAAPSDRTKTAEEKAKDAAEKVKELVIRREKRMRGEAVSDDEEVEHERDDSEEAAVVDEYGNEELGDDAEEFGLASAAVAKVEKVQHVDEDDFDFDADLVASASEADEESASEDDSEVEDDDAAPAAEDNEEDEFISGILGRGANAVPIADPSTKTANTSESLACPRTHADFLALIKDNAVEELELPTLIQRLRSQYLPSLAAENKAKMENFSRVLVEHLVYMAEHDQEMAVMEQVIRHLHSLSRTYAVAIAEALRARLGAWVEGSSSSEGGGGGLGVGKGDLVVLVAIGEIYPTSDHFHQVVTPAFTGVGRWLGLNAGVKGMGGEKGRVGALMVGLCVKWVGGSGRFVPEAVRFTLAALGSRGGAIGEHLENLKGMADLWKEKSAFLEIFSPFVPILRQLGKPARPTLQHLTALLDASRQARKPLMLHHHRPQALRLSNPKFEEGFNPDRHYDPDRERSEAGKLKKEFKREKKGAVRELRKDANFVAREQLRSKRVEDEEHKRRERRLVAEIQSESRN